MSTSASQKTLSLRSNRHYALSGATCEAGSAVEAWVSWWTCPYPVGYDVDYAAQKARGSAQDGYNTPMTFDITSLQYERVKSAV